MNKEKVSKEEKEKVEVKTEEAVKVPIKIGKKIMMHREHNMDNEHKTIRHAAGRAIIHGLEFATAFTKESIKFAKKFVYVHAPVAHNAKEKISTSISKGVKKVREFGENLQAG